MNRTVAVRKNYLHYVKKYHRPLSKLRFNVLEIIPPGSIGGSKAKKAFVAS
ncbi:hypothetical protein HPP92_002258 [Vanilla planifolia]|uniref:Uncharacterized protein n=1 Tax=Vanilla planifolia TaxID=51239 RepID=A0A835S5Y3_VANPL|nr:hypothetical protein HPP92_002258 [Vanilla planifolia]